MSVYLDLHAVQSVPAANLNRDDLGSPKTVRYGRANRIRVSSQSWKRVIRHGVEQELGEYAARTRLLPLKLQAALRHAGWPADLAEFAWTQTASAVGKGLKTEKEGHTSVLLFLPESAINELTTLCQEHRAQLEAAAPKKDKAAQVLPADKVIAILKSRTASISLFGRMLAELPGANVDGAAQVAHAMTTHASEPQRDYFTAVDDWLGQAGESETGSGHLSTAEFSAGVFYRYASVNLDDLLRNLDNDRKLANVLISAFAEQFLMSLPQAKRTSTAPHTIPDLAYLAVRARRPVSFAAAFETPVTADRNGGYSTPSRQALATYAQQVQRLTADRGLTFHGHAGIDESPLGGLGDRYTSFPSLIDAAVAALPDTQEEQQ
ncbi:type I-E CRISPR-associated protein Cas7/Cse4/CasC [Streptomyces sparsogenes]|uniref:type I-E CRISPR-associated protein Cas7/Cse4/CasC n=1 Tax=Streptomyces sparsogenes TaxID=67365 RepID=UPI00332345B7